MENLWLTKRENTGRKPHNLPLPHGFYPSSFSLFLVFLSFVILMTSPAPAKAEAPSLAAIITGMQERYEKIRDFRAGFVQTSTIRATNRTEREEGIVHFKKPLRMRWEYQRPAGKLFITNPEQAWLYLPEDRVVYVQETQKMLANRVAHKFITGLGRISEEFDVALGEKDRRGHFRLTLTPKEPQAEVEKILLLVEGKSFDILQFTVIDFSRNSTSVEFQNLTFNINPPERLFRFRIPAGVETVVIP
jgi:outer membrane lipoprotein carrier protein